jgi:GxxExxY protein
MNHEPHEPHERSGLHHAEEVFRVQGAIYEVNRVLGSGYLEAVYQEALRYELEARAIPFAAKPRLPLVYKGRPMEQTYSPDFVCF